MQSTHRKYMYSDDRELNDFMSDHKGRFVTHKVKGGLYRVTGVVRDAERDVDLVEYERCEVACTRVAANDMFHVQRAKTVDGRYERRFGRSLANFKERMSPEPDPMSDERRADALAHRLKDRTPRGSRMLGVGL
jgi:hypothetical protein